MRKTTKGKKFIHFLKLSLTSHLFFLIKTRMQLTVMKFYALKYTCIALKITRRRLNNFSIILVQSYGMTYLTLYENYQKILQKED